MPPRASVQKISISTGTIIRAVLVLASLSVAWLIRDILLYVFIAFLLAGVIYPFAIWCSKHHIPKSIAVIIFYLLLFGLLALAFALLIPAVFDQTRLFLSNLGGTSENWLKQIVTSVANWSGRQALLQSLPANFTDVEGQLRQTLGSVFNTLVNIFGGIAGFIIVIVLSFYLIAEDTAVKSLFRNVIPNEYQEFATQVIWQMIEKLGAWLRGQFILGLTIGILYFIGYSVVGVPYPLLLALLGGLLEFIPYLGPFISAVPAILLALTISPARALVALVVIIVIQQLESNFIVPKVMQRAVGMNPIVSIIAFMVGAKLFGLVGAIFAIPIATAVSVVLVEGFWFRKKIEA